MKNFSSAEGPDHRPTGLYGPAGGDNTAAGAEGKEWDSPESVSVVVDYLSAIGGGAIGGETAVAAEPDPAGAAAEKTPAKRTPPNVGGVCGRARGGIAGGEAGGRGEPPRAAATRAARPRPPPAADGMSATTSARLLRKGDLHAPADVAAARSGGVAGS